MPILAAPAPCPLTPVVGCEREIEIVRGLLRRPEVRLVTTITGTGGSGKTRLALELAGELASAFADGVAFVPLASLTDPALVPSTIAHGIGVRESGAWSAADALAADLADKEFLPICDNFASVVDAAPFLVRIMAACPRLRILVTSRASPRVCGERVGGRSQSDRLATCPAGADALRASHRDGADEIGRGRLQRGLDRGSAMNPAEARADIEPVLTTIGPGCAAAAASLTAAAAVGLTERENEVLGFLADKLSDEEVGAALFISHRTAMGHVANIFKKVGVTTRADAVERARQFGLLLGRSTAGRERRSDSHPFSRGAPLAGPAPRRSRQTRDLLGIIPVLGRTADRRRRPVNDDRRGER